MDKPINSLPSLRHWSIIQDTSLTGEQGTNRESILRCQLEVHNDYEAMHCWLREYQHKETTYRTYQKEAERFLLWSLFQRKKALSSLDRNDLEAYLQFLDDPQPKEIWCAKKNGRGVKRGDSAWRPFTGPLSETAKTTAVSCIDSLFNYLVAGRYLSFNPLSLIIKRKRSIAMKEAQFTLEERMLTINEWHTMLDTLEHLPEENINQKNEKARLTFLIKILYFLGLRINELATHTWQAFRKIDNDWWFYVVGKGNKLARIPVNDELLRAVITYRAYLKKSAYPSFGDTTPLIASFRGDPITTRQINKILKKLAMATAKRFAHEPDQAKKLKKFSAHWLRHLSASMQDRLGIQFKHIRANHRHENDETTRRYVHAIDRERHQDMQKLTLRIFNHTEKCNDY